MVTNAEYYASLDPGGGAPVNYETGETLTDTQNPNPEPSTQPQPAPSQPDFTRQQTEAQREQELREALANAEKNRQAVIDSGGDVNAFDQSLKDVEAKVQVIDQYKESGEAMPEETKAAIYSPVAPFVNLATGTVDVAGAVKAGIDDEEILKVGATKEDIATVKQAIEAAKDQKDILSRLDKYRQSDGSYDLVGAIRGGHIEDVRRAGFSPDAIVDAQSLAAMKPVIADAMQRLAPYTDSEGRIAGYEYLRYHPEDTSTLRLAGIDNETIKEWQAWAERPAVKANAIDQYHEMVKAAGGTPIPVTLETVFDKKSDAEVGRLALELGYDTRTITQYRKFLNDHPDIAKVRQDFLKEIAKSGRAKADLSLEAFTSEYVAAREDTQAVRDEAALVYKNLYGTRATLGSTATRFTSDYIFAPARALYPEVDAKDITLREWGTGVVQVALLVSPGTSALGTSGKYVQAGLEGTAGGLLTAGIVKDWNTMTPAERGLSIGLDTLVLASAVNRIGNVSGKVSERLSRAKTKIEEAPSPEATQETVSKALVKVGAKPADVDAALTDIRRGIQTGSRAQLVAGAERLQLVSGQVPKELGGKALEDYAKNLLKNPDDYLRLGEGKGLKADDLAKVNESLRANKEHLDLLERQLKNTKSANRKAMLEAERAKVKQIVKTQEKTKVAFREKVIMPEEAGKNVPASRTSTALTVRSGRPTPKATPVSTALVSKTHMSPAHASGKGAPPRTATSTSAPSPKHSPGAEAKPREVEFGYQPSRREKYSPSAYPEPVIITSTRLKTASSPQTETRTRETTKTATATALQTETQTETQTQPATETKTQTATETETKTEAETETKTSPSPAPKTSTPTKTGTGLSGKIKMPQDRTPQPTKERPTPAQLKNADAWPQGMGWWIVYQGDDGQLYRYFHYGERPPRGIKTVRQGLGEARRGIQRFRGRVGQSYIMPMGAYDVEVANPTSHPGKAGAISFDRTRPLPGERRSYPITDSRPLPTTKRKYPPR